MKAEDCAALGEAEKKAIDALAKHTTWKADLMCAALPGWTVFVVPWADSEGAWDAPGVGRVIGLCYCGDQQMFVGTSSWSDSALTHEMAHAFDCALEVPPVYQHAGWVDRGICAAINETTTAKDNCAGYAPKK